MTTNRSEHPSLFTASGCLTPEAMEGFVFGTLTEEEQVLTGKHIDECEFCRDALEGIRQWISIPDQSGRESAPKAGMPNSSLRIPVRGQFQDRVAAINHRLNDRVGMHRDIESIKKERRINRPYTLVAMAASIILFLGIYYLVRTYPGHKQSSFASRNETTGQQVLSPQVLDTANLVTASKKESKGLSIAAETERTVISGNLMDAITLVDEDGSAPARGKAVHPDTVNNKAPSIAGIANARPPSPAKDEAAIEAEVAEENAVFAVVESMPEFPGGYEELQKYLMRNLHYPASEVESGVEGTVYVSFVIDETGKVGDVQIARGLGGELDAEALRVVKAMPDWIPGRQQGKPVKTLYNLPINFKLK